MAEIGIPGSSTGFAAVWDGVRTQVTGARLARYAVLAAQLAIFVLVVQAYHIEEAFGFGKMAVIIFAGFLVHSWLPMAWRLPFFFGLSLLTIWSIFGWVNGGLIVGISLGMIGLCHLPVAFGWRVGAVVAAAAVLVGLRAEWIPTGWGSVVIPIVGSLFMFRLAVYLYDLRHEEGKTSVWARLSYFFLLPNFCFPLFPVIDYQAFKRTYYDREDHDIYQKGMLWIFRGVFQLILYRLVYYNLVPSPAEVVGLGTLIQGMLATYLLYLRLSGQFHLVVGILCLFGFNLPETHRLYYLASGFNDYWRRINIYWKDFMMKMVYYPSFMRLRRFGITPAIAIATMIVFFGTWILHSYQWFWLQGAFPITLTDSLFWGILGALVVINSVFEATRKKKRKIGAPASFSVPAAAVHSLKVVGMFALIGTLWSLWSSPKLGDFVSLMAIAGDSPAWHFGVLACVVAGLVVVGIAIQYAVYRGFRLPGGPEATFAGTSAYSLGGLLMLLALAQPAVQHRLGDRLEPLAASLQREGFNKADEQLFEHGYYEQLLEAEKYTSQLWQSSMNEPPDWKSIQDSDAVRFVDDVRVWALKPDSDTVLKRARVVTNEHGLRDGPYGEARADGVYRVAVLGASYVMGSGVENEETFENLAERRLNEEHAGSGTAAEYEVMNFAVGGYGLVQQVEVLRRVTPFQPDLVAYIMQPGEEERAWYRLMRPIREGKTISEPFLTALIGETGVTPDMPRPEFRRRLEERSEDVLRWSLEALADRSATVGARAAVVLMPSTKRRFEEEEASRLRRIATESGLTVHSMEGVYDGLDPNGIVLAPWDHHPNPKGHELLAQRFYDIVVAEAGLEARRSSTLETPTED